MKRRLLPILLAVFLTLTTVLASPVDACAADICSEGTGNSEGAGYDEGVESGEAAGEDEGTGSAEVSETKNGELSETFESGIDSDVNNDDDDAEAGEEIPEDCDTGVGNEDDPNEYADDALGYEDAAFSGGYLELPSDRNATVLDDSVTYACLQDALIEETEEEQEEEDGSEDALGATEADISAEIPDAYPLSSDDQGAVLSWLTEHYPATRNQYSNTCWAHEAVALAELYLITHGMADTGIDFSELHTAYWCYTTGTGSPVAGNTGDSITFKKTDNLFSPGGNILFAAQTLMQLRGYASEETFPRTLASSGQVQKAGDADPSTERQNVAYLKNYYTISKKNRGLAKQAILENGAVGVSIFSDSANDNGFWNTENAALCTNKKSTDHAVTIVGWDDDYPKENFSAKARPSTNGAWLVRNSWSTTPKFSRYSYCWISYFDTSLSDFVVFEMMGPEDPKFDNSYFYDSQMHNTTFIGSTKCANVFKANGPQDKETLEAVTMEVSYIEKDTSYTVKVYKNVKEGKDPETGTLVSSATTKGKISVNGIYTIPLKEPVELSHGENFAVMVSLSTGMSVATEMGNDNLWGMFSMKTNTKNSESWVYRYDGWHKLTNAASEGNLVLHALTSNGVGEGTITLDPETITFGESNKVGDTAKITATAYDREGNEDTEALILFESSDENVATVDGTGLVTAVGNGTAEIRAKSGRRTAKCTVTVALKEWTVTLDGNGGVFTVTGKNGSLSTAEQLTKTVCNGTAFTPQTPSHTVHEFDKWLDQDSNPVEAEAEIKIFSDLTLTAQWIIPTVDSVSFETVDARGNGDGDSELTPGHRILLSTETFGAFIYYTTDGSDPTKEENPSRIVYTSPIVLTKGMYGELKIKAYAVKEYYNDSSVTSYNCTVIPDPDVEWGSLTEEDKDLFETDENGCPIGIPEGIWVSEKSYEETVAYSGYALTFDALRVYHGNILLMKGKDYTVSYDSNIKASKKASFTVKGKGNYSDKTKKTFTIEPLDLGSEVSPGTFRIASPESFTAVYTGRALKPVPELWLSKDPSDPGSIEGIALKQKTDYTVVYYAAEGFTNEERGEALSAVTEPGDYKAVLTGKKNFKGERILDLKVEEKKSLSAAKISGFKKTMTLNLNPALEAVEQTFAPDPESEGIKLTLNGEFLTPGTDYSIAYKNNRKAGTASMILTGQGEIAGTVTKEFKLKKISIKSAAFDQGTFYSSIEWSKEAQKEGSVIQEDMKLHCNIYPLTEGTDYRVTYKKNTKPGTATVTITGMGRYSGTKSKKFKITSYNITEPDLEEGSKTVRIWVRKDPSGSEWTECVPNENGLLDLGEIGYTPSGGYAKFRLTIGRGEEEPEEDPDGAGRIDPVGDPDTEEDDEEFSGEELLEGRDFTVKYANHKKISTDKVPTVTISGKGRFSGKYVLYFDLVRKELSEDTVTITASDKARSKKAKGLFSAPVLKDAMNGSKLKAGTHYDSKIIYTYADSAVLSNGVIRRPGEKVQNSDILKAGETTRICATVTGKGWYDGEISTTYRVLRGVMSSAEVKINGGKAYTYTGSAIVPTKDEIRITIGGKDLGPTDYEIVSVNNNISAGTAKITLRGIRGYGGRKTFKFKIGKKKLFF